MQQTKHGVNTILLCLIFDVLKNIKLTQYDMNIVHILSTGQHKRTRVQY